MRSPRRPIWWRVAGPTLVISTLVWAAVLLANGVNSVELASLSPRLLPSLLAFILAAASLLVSFPAFWWLVRASGAPSPPLPEFARLHFVSQIMRHLPGRFVGVAYQVALARHVASAPQWLVANATYMSMALWFSATLPVVFLMLVGQIPLLLASLALAATVAFPFAAMSLIAWIVRAIRPTAMLGKIAGVMLAVESGIRSRGFVHALSWFGASWVVYGLAWVAFGVSLSEVGAINGLVLCAFYSLAWALGFLAFVTPSGLGVRELAFAALAKDFPPEVIAYTAVVARLGLLGADLVLGLASIWLGKWRHV